MKKKQNIGLDFIIDKLTNSIENTLTGEVFDTEIVRLISADAKQIKKADWQFDWLKELKDKTKEVYKLTTVNNPTIIQGLVSIEDKQDHVFMHLIESAKFNKGKSKVYFGVQEILLPMFVRFRLTKVMKASLHLTLNRHSSNIIKNLFMRHIFEDYECLSNQVRQ